VYDQFMAEFNSELKPQSNKYKKEPNFNI
jgi:hypothetical protein